MARHTTLAQFEFFVLLAIKRHGGSARASEIQSFIEERAERRAALGAIYATLGRLSDKGLIEDRVGESLPIRGGRGRKSYILNERGRIELARTESAVRRMMDGDGLSPNARGAGHE